MRALRHGFVSFVDTADGPGHNSHAPATRKRFLDAVVANILSTKRIVGRCPQEGEVLKMTTISITPGSIGRPYSVSYFPGFWLGRTVAGAVSSANHALVIFWRGERLYFRLTSDGRDSGNAAKGGLRSRV
jgi:hypothetical protein